MLGAVRDYGDVCVGGFCIGGVLPHSAYWQPYASAVSVLASLAVVVLTFFAVRANVASRESGEGEMIETLHREIGIMHRERARMKERIRSLEEKTRQRSRGDAASPLNNEPWLNLAEECVELLDELDELRPAFDPARRMLAEHVMSRLEEALERSGIEVISGDIAFDRNRHKPERASAAASGATIAETLSPGFAVGQRVLRRARVRLHHGKGQ